MTARHVPARARRRFRLTGWLALALVLQQPAGALAQAAADERVLQSGDTLVLTVPGRPELDRTLVVDPNGRIAVPQVGDVAVAGLTVPEAGEVLRQRLRVFYPNLGAVDVALQGGMSLRLYVIGEVRDSGHYDFAAPPSAWDLLRTAGGPSEGADLARARVVRVEDGRTVVETVDLSGVLSGRGAPDLELRHGDTLVVPAAGGAAAVSAAAGVQVFGAVTAPAVVPVEEPTELVQVMMMAGAPTTEADLGAVWWVHRGPDGFRSTKVDVRRFLEEGDRLGNPLVYPGDTLEVRQHREGWGRTVLPVILGVIATAATVALAYDRLATD